MRKIKRWIGCDPGQTGAMVSIREDNTIEIVPFDEEEYRTKLEEWSKEDTVICAVEKENSMPGQGVSSVFSFGTTYGWLQGLLYGLHIPYVLVASPMWKKAFSLNLNKSYFKVEKKQRTIDTVKHMYPDINLKRTARARTDDNNIADATMIATWCKQKHP